MEKKFIEVLKEALERDEEVQLTDQFRDYDEWDSLSRLSLIALLDEEFEVQIEDDVFVQLKTVADLMGVVQKARP